MKIFTNFFIWFHFICQQKNCLRNFWKWRSRWVNIYQVYIVICGKVWEFPITQSRGASRQWINMELNWLQIVPLDNNNQSVLSLEINIPKHERTRVGIYIYFIVFWFMYRIISCSKQLDSLLNSTGLCSAIRLSYLRHHTVYTSPMTLIFFILAPKFWVLIA